MTTKSSSVTFKVTTQQNNLQRYVSQNVDTVHKELTNHVNKSFYCDILLERLNLLDARYFVLHDFHLLKYKYE